MGTAVGDLTAITSTWYLSLGVPVWHDLHPLIAGGWREPS